MAAPLDGITVIDASTGQAAALATMLLSDLGARVIRLVGPRAPRIRDGGFVIWDRGKECVALDLEQALGDGKLVEAFRALVSGADVLVEDVTPDAPAQALVDHEALAACNPRLVSCSITAYGKRGPLRHEPPVDDLVLARMGVLGGMPGFRPAPVHIAFPLPSVGAAVMACLGVASALLAREDSGHGRAVETSLMSGALLYHPKVIGERMAPHVFQTHPSGSAPFYSVYECADGNYVQLGCVHEGFIRAGARVMGIEQRLAEAEYNAETPEGEAALRALLTQVMLQRSSAEWAEAFEAADVPFAPARLTEDGLDDPQVRHNGLVVTLDDPVLGPVEQMGVPIHFTETPGHVSGPRPATEHHPDDAAAAAPAAGQAAADSAPLQDPPLAGVRILEITNLIAGPTAGRLLADLGADVIKLEPPAGDMSRPIGRTYFYNLNFNKHSVCVDTSGDAGKRVVQAIAASADALVANLRPGATERMGIGPAVNPNLIETHLTGYGWTGPYARRPGIDPLAQALMGLSRAQGGAGNPPVFAAQLAPTDYTTGAMGALGTVLALYQRRRHGIVQRVESNLLNGAIILSSAWFARYRGLPERPLADPDQYGLSPFHRLYRLADGWVYVAADDAASRAALCRLAGVAVTTTEPAPADGHANETPLAHALAEALAGRGLAETLAALKAAGVPAAEAQAGDSELFLTDPHALANDMVAVVDHPGVGRLTVGGRYIQFGQTRRSKAKATPLLGEQSAQVLREIDFAEDAIAELRDAGVIRIETI